MQELFLSICSLSCFVLSYFPKRMAMVYIRVSISPNLQLQLLHDILKHILITFTSL